MHNAESILVIIVSTTLTIFLLLAIAVLVLTAKLIKAVIRIVNRAEQVIETAEEAAEVLRNASGPLAFFKVVSNIVKTVEKMHNNRRER